MVIECRSKSLYSEGNRFLKSKEGFFFTFTKTKYKISFLIKLNICLKTLRRVNLPKNNSTKLSTENSMMDIAADEELAVDNY